MFFISLQKLFLFLRKNKFRNLDIQISWGHFFFSKNPTNMATWKLVPDPFVFAMN